MVGEHEGRKKKKGGRENLENNLIILFVFNYVVQSYIGFAASNH